MKGDTITKTHDKMLMTKRRRNSEQIKNSTTPKREKTEMKCNHTQSWGNKGVPTDEIKKARALPNKKLHAELKRK